MLRSIVPGLIFVVALTATAHGDTCAQLESRVDLDLTRLPFVADQWGLIGEIRGESEPGTKECPTSSVLWYGAIRGAELISLRSSDTENDSGLALLVKQALDRAIPSARLLTMVSRITKSESLARKAVELDPKYRAAQRSLAFALLNAGNFEEALKVCGVKGRKKEDLILEANVRLGKGDTKGAIGAARRAVMSTQVDLSEPTPGQILYREAYEVLGLSLEKGGYSVEARKAFDVAASAGSSLARQRLTTGR